MLLENGLAPDSTRPAALDLHPRATQRTVVRTDDTRATRESERESSHARSRSSWIRRLTASVLFAAIAPVIGAHAGDVEYKLAAVTGANSGPYTTDGPRREVYGGVALTSGGQGDQDSVCCRYISTNTIDIIAGGNTESEGATSSYFLELWVTETLNQPWRLKVVSHFRGDCNVINDNGNDARAELSTPVSATYSIDGVPRGHLPQLEFAQVSASNESDSGSDVHTDISFPNATYSGVALIDGFGTGGQQLVRLDFQWSTNVVSHGGIGGGDEASVRLGYNADHWDNIDAGRYPGSPSRVQVDDGHFVFASLCPMPSVGIQASGSTSICSGQSVTLTAVGGWGTSAQWFSECCCGNPIAIGGRSITVSPSVTTTYFMRWIGPEFTQSPCGPTGLAIPSCGATPCSPGITVVVTQPPQNPLAATATDTDVCADTLVVLQAFGGGAPGATLHWYAGACGTGTELGTGAIFPVQPSQTTHYFARWENPPCAPSSCVDVQVNVTPKPLDPTGVTADFTTVCANSPAVLTLVGGGNGTVHWYADSCGGTPVGTLTPVITVNPQQTTRYFARWENLPCSASICKDILITVTDPPTPPTAVVANPPTVCAGERTTLTATAPSGRSLVWTKDGPTGEIVGHGNDVDVYPTGNTVYFAHCEAAPCPASASASTTVVVLTPNSPPDFILVTPGEACAGTGTVLLSASGGVGTDFQWFSGSCGGTWEGEGSSISVPTPMDDTRYFVRRISDTCPPSDCISTLLTVVPRPTPPTSITLPHSICAGSSTTLTVSGGSGDVIRWFANSIFNPSFDQGPSISVTPGDTTNYFACYERLPCGLSAPISTTVTVDVAPSTPTFASATPNLVCAGVGTIVLDVVGNGPGNFDWYADSCGGTYVGSGPSLTIPAPLADTTYFVRRSNGACSPSGCISVAVDTEATPFNDDPSFPITLVAETRRFNTNCAHDDVLVGSTLVRSVVYNSMAPISACGMVQVSVSPPSEKGIAIYTDPLGATTPVATGIGTAVFQAAPGQLYTIFAGDVGSASGVGFITIIEDVGVPSAATFTLGGTASGSAWSWRISSNQTGFPGPSDFETLLTGNVSGAAVPPPGASATQIAQAFAASINTAAGACASDHIAGYASLFFPVLSIAYDERPTPPGWGIRLEIGPFPGTPNCLVDSSGTDCTFLLPLMSIHREVLPGEDCNENGFDDVIDVLAGTSLDTDGNGIPDECSNNTAAAYCFGDGTGEFCPCGNNGAHGRGCANSQVVAGAKLSAIGAARVANDSVVLQASGMTGGTAIFFQGGSALPQFTVDDGLGCVGGPIIRLGTKSVTANASSFPAPGDPLVSVRGQLPPAGGTRYYQCFYRNAASAFCPPATSNRTNGLIIDWRP